MMNYIRNNPIPTRNEMLDEMECGNRNDFGYLPLFEGIFIEGELDFLSEEDWSKLALIHGLPEKSSKERIKEMIFTEQNKNINELLDKGYEHEIRTSSNIRNLIRTFK